MNKKASITVLIIILLVAVGGWYGWRIKHQGPAKPESYRINGQTVEVSDTGIVTVSGYYAGEDDVPIGLPKEPSIVHVKTDANTKIIKTLLYLPGAEELKATGGRYDPSKLKRETAPNTIVDLKKSGRGTVVTITFNADIYNQPVIFANQIKDITYISPVYPASRPASKPASRKPAK